MSKALLQTMGKGCIIYLLGVANRDITARHDNRDKMF